MATYSRNTTTKVGSMPRGSYTFPVNTNSDLLVVPTGYRYRITCLAIDVTFGGSNALRFKDAAGVFFDIVTNLTGAPTAGDNVDVPNATTNVKATVVKKGSTLFFNPPLELSEGQGLNISNTSGGNTAGARNWSTFGENLINTP